MAWRWRLSIWRWLNGRFLLSVTSWSDRPSHHQTSSHKHTEGSEDGTGKSRILMRRREMKMRMIYRWTFNFWLYIAVFCIAKSDKAGKGESWKCKTYSFLDKIETDKTQLMLEIKLHFIALQSCIACNNTGGNDVAILPCQPHEGRGIARNNPYHCRCIGPLYLHLVKALLNSSGNWDSSIVEHKCWGQG